MNIVYESLNEFVSRDEDQWADNQIDKWKEMEKTGLNPLELYVKTVVNIIYNNIPDNVLQYTGTDKYIIEDIITAYDDWQLIDMNIYDFWENKKSEEEAAEELGEALHQYIVGQTDTM